VNGQYIFLEDYERQVAIYEGALQDQGFDLASEEGRAEADQIRADVLEGLIDSLLMRQEAEKMGLALSEEELDAQIVADIEDGGGEAAFDEWLEATGQTRADYREMLHDLLLSERILEVVAADLPTVADQVHIRHIAVSSPEAAQEIVTQLQDGADFVELASARSEDTLTRDDGGDLGWFPAGIVALELEQAAFSLREGEISGVIQLGEGYHVIQLVEREAGRAISPDLEIDLELVAFEQWLEDLRASAAIERFVGQ
jgi:parvulin-like peptidyl-prolyl isomerase